MIGICMGIGGEENVGGSFGTVPELLFEKKGLILAEN